MNFLKSLHEDSLMDDDFTGDMPYLDYKFGNKEDAINKKQTNEIIALQFGLSYENTDNFLPGTIRDAEAVHQYVTKLKNFTDSQIIDGKRYNNILTNEIYTDKTTLLTSAFFEQKVDEALKRLASSKTQKQTLFIHYAGHGVLTPDKKRKELSNMNSALIFRSNKDSRKLVTYIDDRFLALLTRYYLPTLTIYVVTDCCHSATMLDLPIFNEYNNSMNMTTKGSVTPYPKIVIISGCKDEETSKETNGRGFLTGSLVDTLNGLKADNINVMNLFDVIENDVGRKVDALIQRIEKNSRTKEERNQRMRTASQVPQISSNMGVDELHRLKWLI